MKYRARGTQVYNVEEIRKTEHENIAEPVSTVVGSKLKIPAQFGRPARFSEKNKPKEAAYYDFRSARTNLPRPNGIVGSVLHILTYGLGAGIPNMHVAYRESGIWTGLVLNVILCVLVGHCSCILVRSAQKMYGRVQIPNLSYQDLAEASLLLSPWRCLRKCARAFRYLVELTLALHCFGSCCVFVIMIARNLKDLVEGTEYFRDDGDPPLTVYIISLVIPCTAVCMVTNLKNLAPFAIIANFYAAAVLLCTMWYCLKYARKSPLDRKGYKNVMGVFEFVGMCLFVSETASIALPIEKNMDKPREFHRVILLAMPILTAMTMAIGFFGVWHYGDNSVPPILLHFPFKPIPIQLKVFLCLIVYVIYATTFFIGFDILWFYLKKMHLAAHYSLYERLYRIILVCFVISISYYSPNISTIMGVVGSSCTAPFLFLYPPFIELIVDWEYPGLGRFRWRLIKFIVFFIISIVIIVVGTYYNVHAAHIKVRQGHVHTFDPDEM
ncbi:hypothetical protein HW555_008246 [Spodoptera exigua]|uniref:Amino acid transporter transmembrane domain-containing protein n=1 Tax=Spodoptera exigua TaxID=7107 RepID=A0A835L4M7_SPOEX|nr:hypothetical protein HW555_008246 [Spodoptera exigua]